MVIKLNNFQRLVGRIKKLSPATRYVNRVNVKSTRHLNALVNCLGDLFLLTSKPEVRKATTSALAFSFVIVCSSFTLPVYGNTEDRVTQQVRERAYRNLDLAQQHVDAKNWAEAERELGVLKQGEARLNEYERALMYNLYGFIAFSRNQLPEAINNYEQVINNRAYIPQHMEESTLYGLSQLHFGESNFSAAIDYMQQWETLSGKQSQQGKLLTAQSYYQQKDYQSAIEPLLAAMRIHEEESETAPEENWLLLLRILYFETKQNDQALNAMYRLVELYPQTQYYLQLATFHGQLGNNREQMSILESLEERGELDDESSILNLATLYLDQETPILAARLIQRKLNEALLAPEEKILRQLATAYALAKEYPAASDVYVTLADQFNSEFLLDAAQMTWLAEDYTATLALLQNIQNLSGEVYAEAILLRGMGAYYTQNFNQARNDFSEIRNHAKFGERARQWLDITNNEQQRVERNRQYL